MSDDEAASLSGGEEEDDDDLGGGDSRMSSPEPGGGGRGSGGADDGEDDEGGAGGDAGGKARQAEDEAQVALKRQIRRAFEVFDHERNGTVDVREVGTILRSLGAAPSEADLHHIITQCQTDDSAGFVHYERMEGVFVKALADNKYPRDNEERLLKAFQVLDTEGKVRGRARMCVSVCLRVYACVCL
jgi:hypothetical protein